MNRIELINTLIAEKGFKSYLELGIYDGSTFDNIVCDNKVSVDLNFDAMYQMTTDDFFLQNNDTYDIIFVDADHRSSQVIVDIYSSLFYLNPNGIIVCHDCNPPTEADQIDENNLYQSAWKAFVKFSYFSKYITYCIPDDCGLGIIDTCKESTRLEVPFDVDIHNLQYKDLEKYRSLLLNFKDDIIWS